METNLSQEILTRVDALAQKLGVTAEYLWPKAAGYIKIDALSTLGLTILIIPACLYIIYRAVCLKEEDFEKRAGFAFSMILLAAIGLGTIIGCSFALQQAIGNFLAPEGATLFYLLGK